MGEAGRKVATAGRRRERGSETGAERERRRASGVIHGACNQARHASREHTQRERSRPRLAPHNLPSRPATPQLTRTQTEAPTHTTSTQEHEGTAAAVPSPHLFLLGVPEVLSLLDLCRRGPLLLLLLPPLLILPLLQSPRRSQRLRQGGASRIQGDSSHHVQHTDGSNPDRSIHWFRRVPSTARRQERAEMGGGGGEEATPAFLS